MEGRHVERKHRDRAWGPASRSAGLGGRWWVGVGIAAVLGAGLGPVAGPRVVRADPAVAQILIDQAKKAISSGDLDTAVQRLTRASEEEPAAIEATYLLGTVHERRKDPGKALAAYRAFRDAAAEQRRTDTLDKRLAPLVKKADERIAVLGKGEAELDALQVAFARKVLEAARRAQRDDPDLARHAATSLLAVVPGHAEARKFLDELGGSTSTDRDPAPIPGIERWTDLLATKAIEPAARVTYADGMMSLEQTGGSVFWTSTGLRAEEPAVLEIEFRCTRELAAGWLVGVSFGRGSAADGKDAEFVNVFAQGSRVAAVQATEGRQVELGSTVVPPLGDRWHRLAVGLEQGKVRIFLDGKRLSSNSVPGRDSLEGEIGVIHQRCRADIRLLRLGSAR